MEAERLIVISFVFSQLSTLRTRPHLHLSLSKKERRRRPIAVFVEPHRTGTRHLRNPDDLTSVTRKVLDHVVDRFHDGRIAPLDQATLEQLARQQPAEYLVHLTQRRIQAVEHPGSGRTTARGELHVPLANIRLATDSAHEPLPHVPRQVQQQVADAIGMLVRAPPEPVSGMASTAARIFVGYSRQR